MHFRVLVGKLNKGFCFAEIVLTVFQAVLVTYKLCHGVPLNMSLQKYQALVPCSFLVFGIKNISFLFFSPQTVCL